MNESWSYGVVFIKLGLKGVIVQQVHAAMVKCSEGVTEVFERSEGKSEQRRPARFAKIEN